jgi:transmembrane sensor
MVDKDSNIDKHYEDVLDFMENSDGLSDEQLDALKNDDQFMEAYHELSDCRKAVRQKYSHLPDVDKEWEKFNHKHSHRPNRFMMGAIVGVAASFLIVFLYSWFSKTQPGSVTVFEANAGLQQVTLQTASGENIALNRSTQTAVKALGTQLTNENDTMELKYNANVAKVETHVLTIPRGQVFKVVLADGTQVWMNAESRLVYPSQFRGKERIVSLHGEAYFKVAKDKAHPFIIKTERMQTRVLGTEFNIRNYSANDSHVTLIEGSVEVYSSKQKSYTRICPGEDAQLQGNGTFAVRKVDVDSYIYWKEGFFYFDNVPFVDIMQSLGRWYNVNVVFQNKPAMSYRLHYLCDRKSGLPNAVKLLNSMSRISVRLDKNTLYIQ